MTSPISIAWFRQDLRLADNPALRAAAEAGRVLPVYILDDTSAGEWRRGAASRAWLHQSLRSLDHSLDGQLRCFVGDAEEIITRLVRSLPVSAVYWNRGYEPWRRQRDSRIKQRLTDAGLDCRSFNASLLWEPWKSKRTAAAPTGYLHPSGKRAVCGRDRQRRHYRRPSGSNCLPKPCPTPALRTSSVCCLRSDGMRRCWPTGRSARPAPRTDWTRFCDSMIGDYQRQRDLPAQAGTSRLSPHLHFGELSPRQAWHRAEQARFEAGHDGVVGFSARAGLARVFLSPAVSLPGFARVELQSPLRRIRMARRTKTECAPGNAGKPVSRSSTRACASSGKPATCTIGCA